LPPVITTLAVPVANLSPVPVVHLGLRISPRIFEKFVMTLMLFSGAWGEYDSLINLKQKFSCHCPFNSYFSCVTVATGRNWTCSHRRLGIPGFTRYLTFNFACIFTSIRKAGQNPLLLHIFGKDFADRHCWFGHRLSIGK
jgi:hypothetical protein